MVVGGSTLGPCGVVDLLDCIFLIAKLVSVASCPAGWATARTRPLCLRKNGYGVEGL